MIPMNPFASLLSGGGTAIGDAGAARMRLSLERERDAKQAGAGKDAREPDALQPAQPGAPAPAAASTPADLPSH